MSQKKSRRFSGEAAQRKGGPTSGWRLLDRQHRRAGRLARLERAVRVVCNRDELRSRAAALPPRVCTFGERRAVMPIDLVSGGTWIAANRANGTVRSKCSPSCREPESSVPSSACSRRSS